MKKFRKGTEMAKFFFLSFFLLCIFSAAAAQERFVEPVDEAKRDASFFAFREKLIEAARKRDAKHILSVLDRNIMNDFGGGSGIEDFKKKWKVENSDSKFWKEFTAVIENGGTFSEETGGAAKIFTAPFTFAAFPEDLDAFQHAVIFGKNVNLRARPDLNSETVARLSYNVVKVNYENSVRNAARKDEYSWLKVKTLGGKRGYIRADYVRSPIDYRAGFQKKNGVWKMIYFIAGD